MDSLQDDECSHSSGFPIRKSPDHSVLATPRGLSQLAASFIAYLRQGIHTHALSSLTIKFTLNTECPGALLLSSPASALTPAGRRTCAFSCPSIFDFQRSRLPLTARSQKSTIDFRRFLTSDFCSNLVGLGRVELPTSPLSGVRSSHLSYRPARSPDSACRWWS